VSRRFAIGAAAQEQNLEGRCQNHDVGQFACLSRQLERHKILKFGSIQSTIDLYFEVTGMLSPLRVNGAGAVLEVIKQLKNALGSDGVTIPLHHEQDENFPHPSFGIRLDFRYLVCTSSERY
jgi:hypothetical protein